MAEYYVDTITLTHDAALKAIAAGIGKAEKTGIPQCLVVVDPSGETIASVRMTGAKFLSLRSALAKARTAASINGASGGMPIDIGTAAAVATAGGVTPLPGGLPIRFNGRLAGAIGVGSGSGEQDVAVAKAAIASLGADPVT
ncbi:MAG: heme-binding protein [Pseudomonadota bacterium]